MNELEFNVYLGTCAVLACVFLFASRRSLAPRAPWEPQNDYGKWSIGRLVKLVLVSAGIAVLFYSRAWLVPGIEPEWALSALGASVIPVVAWLSAPRPPAPRVYLANGLAILVLVLVMIALFARLYAAPDPGWLAWPLLFLLLATPAGVVALLASFWLWERVTGRPSAQS